MDHWYCLPLNVTYELGGSIVDLVKYIKVDIQCGSTNRSCTTGFSDTLLIQFMTLNTFVNPNNNTQPFIAYLNRR